MILVIAIASWFWPQKDEPAAEGDGAAFDAFAGGHPVPPMPGQQLPPSRRRVAREAREPVTVGAPTLTKGAEDRLADAVRPADGPVPDSPTPDSPAPDGTTPDVSPQEDTRG